MPKKPTSIFGYGFMLLFDPLFTFSSMSNNMNWLQSKIPASIKHIELRIACQGANIVN